MHLLHISPPELVNTSKYYPTTNQQKQLIQSNATSSVSNPRGFSGTRKNIYLRVHVFKLPSCYSTASSLVTYAVDRAAFGCGVVCSLNAFSDYTCFLGLAVKALGVRSHVEVHLQPQLRRGLRRQMLTRMAARIATE